MKQITYTESFKLAAVKQVLEDGDRISQTARCHGVTPISLSRWIDKYKINLVSELDGEHMLKKQLSEITKEREILRHH